MKSCRTCLKRCHGKGGFTVVEIMVVVAILGTLSAIALPVYRKYIETANVTRAIAEIKILSGRIAAYEAGNQSLPTTLNDIGRGGLLDPWRNPYRYLNYAAAGPGDKIRKDRNLHPLNSDYDLYSMGKDGKSSAPITAQTSQDDIIRANDGRFIGLAANY